jgi:ketosteroid isomerase-like protein
MDSNAATPDLVQMLFAALNSRDLSALEHHLAEDAGFDFPGPGLISGRKKILLFLKILFRKFNRLTFSVERIIQDGDCACVIWTNEGHEKTGEAYRNRGITFLQFEEGKIIFLSDYFKDTSFIATA